MFLSLFIILALSSTIIAQDALPPWDNPIFDFEWDAITNVLPNCQTINITLSTRRDANPLPVPPYSVYVLTRGNEPGLVVTSEVQEFQWEPRINTGHNDLHVLWVEDANGYSSASPQLFFTIPNADCLTRLPPVAPLQSLMDGSFHYQVNGHPDQCDKLKMIVEGGTPPYKFQTFAGQHPIKTTYWSTDTMVYVVDIPQGSNFFLMATDAMGKVATQGPFNVNAGSDTCIDVASTVSAGSITSTYSFEPAQFTPEITRSSSSGTSTSLTNNTNPRPDMNPGVIIGAVFGSLSLVSIIVGILLFLRYRRRRMRRRIKPELDQAPQMTIISPHDFPRIWPYHDRLHYEAHGTNNGPQSVVQPLSPRGATDEVLQWRRSERVTTVYSNQSSSIPSVPTTTQEAPTLDTMGQATQDPIIAQPADQWILSSDDGHQPREQGRSDTLKRAPTAPPPYTFL